MEPPNPTPLNHGAPKPLPPKPWSLPNPTPGLQVFPFQKDAFVFAAWCNDSPPAGVVALLKDMRRTHFPSYPHRWNFISDWMAAHPATATATAATDATAAALPGGQPAATANCGSAVGAAHPGGQLVAAARDSAAARPGGEPVAGAASGGCGSDGGGSSRGLSGPCPAVVRCGGGRGGGVGVT